MRKLFPLALLVLAACGDAPTEPEHDPIPREVEVCRQELLASREVVSKVRTENYSEADGRYFERWLNAAGGWHCYVGPNLYARTAVGQKATCSWEPPLPAVTRK